MKWLDLTFPTPAENLACDEALLDDCEEQGGPEVLRFWEPANYFVVVGFSNHVAQEVNVPACEKNNIGIFRRCSGGGTVLQGPGCLNYTLILRIDRNPALHTITSANGFIMERHRDALGALLGQKVEMLGHTDLAWDGLKFSGNAQRRKRQALIFHGTFLLDFDLTLMEKYLLMPSRQPDYRHDRPHGRFVRNLSVAAKKIKEALRQAWGADAALEAAPDCRSLVEEKYSRDDWNFKFQ
jgi:lipoate-protein ligase A